MNRIFSILLLLLFFFPASDGYSATDENGGASTLPPEEFLQWLRQPLSRDAWGELAGKLSYAGDGKKQEGVLRIRITFAQTEMMAQIVLNENNTYIFEQHHDATGKLVQNLERPEKETQPGLFDYGITPADITFSFLYWDFLEELPSKTSRMRTCRVLRLKSPDSSDIAEVLFDTTYGFPLEIRWYHDKEDKKPWRTLIMKGAKRHANGLWFVREMRLNGPGWKTRVTFDFVEKNDIGDNTNN